MPSIKIPEALEFLFEPARLKVILGGRGGAKSESVGRYLLIEGAKEPMTILCTREYQNSLKDSVYQVIKNIIESNDQLKRFYQVLTTEIRGRNGTTFIFAGLHRNISNIKSIPNIKKCWVEEAETVSDHSWLVLTPTIRAEGSEIIVTFNPDIEDSPTYQRMVANPPSYALVRKVGYRDNPYFPDVLEQERVEMLNDAKDPNKSHVTMDDYNNVWEGECRAAVKGAVFAKEIRKAMERTDQYPQSRITDVPYDKSKPVDIHYDLGRADKTAMWFVQIIGYEIRLINYYENNGEHFSHYIKYTQDTEYVLGNHYLPHDAVAETVAADKSVQRQSINAFGRDNVKIVKRTPKKVLAIDAARSIIDRCVWDKVKCADGLTCLRKWAYKVDPDSGRTSREPEHDNPWSHGGDSFLSIGQTLKEFVRKREKKVFNKPKISYLPKPVLQ